MKRVLIIIAAALAAVLLIYGVVWLAMGWVAYPQFYSGVRQVQPSGPVGRLYTPGDHISERHLLRLRLHDRG